MPLLGGSRRNIAIPFGAEKLEWWGYPTVKKIEDMCNHLDTIPVCYGQTDGQTSCHGIVRAMHKRRAVKTHGPDLPLLLKLHEIWSVDSQENRKNCCHHVRF